MSLSEKKFLEESIKGIENNENFIDLDLIGMTKDELLEKLKNKLKGLNE